MSYDAGKLRSGRLMGLVVLALSWPAASFAQTGPALEPVGSQQALEEIIEAAQPDCEAQPELCPPAPPGLNQNEANDEVVVTGSRIAAPSITSNQSVGVDEGDLVKARGDTLVIMRRGRLFTIDTAGGRLRLVDTIEAYPPGVNAGDDWYDEMLISGDRVVVIGYSYGRGGTEINRFLIDKTGRLTFEDSHHLRSGDYYSSRNYASRLIGDELIVYTPVDTGPTGDPLEQTPSLRRWRSAADDQIRGVRLLRAEEIYRAPGLGTDPDVWADTIHTVIRCDLSARELTCRATGILGPDSRNFYVAPTAVYVWMGENRWNLPKGEEPGAWLYRIPLDGGRPQAAAVRGMPIDQFSFREDPDAALINVMVVSDGEGEGMWGAEQARGGAALLRLPLARFGDGETEPREDDYRALPALAGGWGAQNRFVGDHLLYSDVLRKGYSAGDEAAPEEEGRITVVPLDGGPLVRFTVPGAVGRIEQTGPDALAVSSAEDAFFTSIDLQTPRPTISDQFVMVGSAETESRSHAFYYRPDPSSVDGSRGVLGLPVTRPGPPGRPLAPGRRNTLETIAYLRRDGAGRLRDLGWLEAGPVQRIDDGCVASCVDWYGDARPIFLGDRIFALLGYEVVEGREQGGRIREVRRIDVTPPPPPGPRPYYPD